MGYYMTNLNKSVSNSSRLRAKLLPTIITSWIILITIQTIGIINPNTDLLSLKYILYITLSSILFYTGIFITKKNPKKNYIGLKKTSVINIFYTLVTIAIVCKISDRLLIRTPIELSISSFREAREQGSNIFSFLSALLLPICIIYFDKFKDSIRTHAVFYLLILIYTVDIALSGSRGSLLIIAIYLLAERFTLKKIALAAPIAIIISGIFFEIRFQSLTGSSSVTLSTLQSLSTEGYAKFVPASPWLLEYIESQYGIYFFSLAQIAQYITHSVYEFAYIFNTQEIKEIDPTQILPFLLKVIEPTNTPENFGMYYTLFGSAHLAFGYYSIIIIFFIGLFYGVAMNCSLKISDRSGAFIIFCIFISPYVNSIGAYDIFFYLISIIVVSKISIKTNTNHENKNTNE